MDPVSALQGQSDHAYSVNISLKTAVKSQFHGQQLLKLYPSLLDY